MERSRRSWFGSLRARLIVSHALVLVLALLLVLAITGVFIRRNEQSAEGEQLQTLVLPLMVEAAFHATQPGQDPVATRPLVAQVLQRQADRLGVRLLVFDANGTVRLDTGAAGSGTGSLQGQTLSGYAGAIDDVLADARQSGTVVRRLITPTGGPDDPFAASRVVIAADWRAPEVALGLIAPMRHPPLVGALLAHLLLALGVSLGVAAVVGYLLSRKIASRVSRLTVAADAMAAGSLEQRVPGEGSDEIGRLVASFNAMSSRVAATARSQRELLANVAHELRTPLTSVRGYVQALRDGVVIDPAERVRVLTTISEEADRMARLVSELLDLARLESGQIRLSRAPVELAPALNGIATRFGPDAAQRGIALTATAPAGLVIEADAERLAQILGNLVENALRHTPAGGAVSLTAAPLAGPGKGHAGVRLTVRDTGHGIPPDRLDHIFDRFERVEAPVDADGTGRAEGFGLGLAIVRELVAAHGGTIAVASTVGAGTTFTIDLLGQPGP